MSNRVLLFILTLLLSACGSSIPETKTRAAPPFRAASRAQPMFRLAFGSCARQSDPQPFWASIAKTQPELFLFIGDNMYADKPGVPASPEEIRTAYTVLGANSEFAAFRERFRLEAIWDDHDYGVNDGGADYAHRAYSEEAFLDFYKAPKDDPRRTRPGIYYAFTVGSNGQRVQVIMLDTRSFRSPLFPRPEGDSWWAGRWAPSTSPDQTMLGEAQWAWLERKLEEPAEVRLLVSSIQVVAEDHGWEKWANLPNERQRLFKLLQKTGTEGLIVLSGDRHKGELSVMDAGLGYPLYDFTSSGLNAGHKNWFHFEKNQHRVATMRWGDNFGLVDINWDQNDPSIELTLSYSDGAPAFTHRLLLSTLKKGAMPPLPEE